MTAIPSDYSTDCLKPCPHTGTGPFSRPDYQCMAETEPHSEFCAEHGGVDMTDTHWELFLEDVAEGNGPERCECLEDYREV